MREDREPAIAGQGGYRDRLADEARSRIREIKPGELAKFRALPLILDVREKDEFVRGHIAGAKHVSRGVLEQKICEKLLTIPARLWCIAQAEIEVPWRRIISRSWGTKMCFR